MTIAEPKLKWVQIPDFRFYKDSKRLKQILDKELESKIDPALWLSEDEDFEKQVIQESGYTNWSRRDYNRLMEAFEIYAKDDYENLS